MLAQSDNSIKFRIFPWNNFKLEMIDLYEEIGGNIASGKVILSYMGTKNSWETLLNNNNAGTIEIVDTSGDSDNIILKIPYFINNRVISGNRLTLNITCVRDRTFTDRISTLSFNNLEKAIKSIYPGEIFSNVGPDSYANSNKIYQVCESDYSLCNKLCLSYRRNIVFSYGFKGLYIKDVALNQRTEKNSYRPGANFETSSVPTYEQNRTLDHLPFNCWTQIGQGAPTKSITKEPFYCTSLGLFDKNYIVGRNYGIMLDNYLYNSRLLNNSYVSTIINFYGLLPKFDPGDVIFLNNGFEGNPDNFKKYIVKSNELFFAANDNEFYKTEKELKFSTITKLVNFDTGEWVSNIY